MVICAGALWGTVAVSVRILVRDMDPALIAFTRIFLGGMAVTAYLFVKEGVHLPHVRWRLVGVGALGMALNYLLFTLGLKYTLASAAAMVVQSEVVFLVVLSVILLGESFGSRKAVGLGMALTGVVIITWNGEDLGRILGSEYLLGNVIVVGAGFFWAVYALSQKRLMVDHDVLDTLSPILLLSSLMLLPVAAPSLGRYLTMGPWEILGLLYLGIICTGLSYLLLTRGMRELPASTTGVMTTVMPVMSVILASIVLKEALTAYIVIGAALDLGGVILVAQGGA
jgi:drug/metabolite transporter (DMT)-like permease